jgi:formylglycine-generating enzyme required for sulfatase activity
VIRSLVLTIATVISTLPATTIQAQQPTESQLALLKVFHREFVAIGPGTKHFSKTFQMGGGKTAASLEQPKHSVAIAYNFAVARYEVPQNLWEVVMGSNPSKWKGPRNSVEMLSFAEAQDFCHKTTQLMRLATLIKENQVVRLPSEAEWEYFARAGTETIYSFGDAVDKLDDYGWHTGNAAGNDPPVGAKKPNPWGLYDIHGYLSEWCLDTGHNNYDQAPSDGSAWITADNKTRVTRGGSWKDKPLKLTSSFRFFVPADHKDDALGLRCVLTTKK